MPGKLIDEIPRDWRDAIASRGNLALSSDLEAFVESEYGRATIYPARERLFASLAMTSPADVRVVIVGQDPYHGPGQAHGLCFSVRPGQAIPPSLRNIYRELRDDLGIEPPGHGCLSAWARRGVLLFNTTLTVRAGEPQSHAGRGWEKFSDAILETIANKSERVVFLLWGKPAQTKRSFVERKPHVVLASAHPSPLSARRGFLGSRPFSRTNAALVGAGLPPIDWRLPPVEAIDPADY